MTTNKKTSLNHIKAEKWKGSTYYSDINNLTNFSAAEWLEETSQLGEGRKFLKLTFSACWSWLWLRFLHSQKNYEEINTLLVDVMRLIGSTRKSLQQVNYLQVCKRGPINNRVRDCPCQVIISKISANKEWRLIKIIIILL
jgi:hypothetical protein